MFFNNNSCCRSNYNTCSGCNFGCPCANPFIIYYLCGGLASVVLDVNNSNIV